ncbi:Imm48 family immunity protein [Acinetobacter courvalinii]|uniref:Imm48 family immunity protein n=1 Tax=Acinetobacter courvalinii TaxID=280147 RepID=A0AA42L9U6_9GAMM|nr:Imm48 family immunity protein [Acinetobacter courvalinii]MDH0563469.1 Imm48 family immunity protein [Acinetobacter courvalinii]
MTWQIEQNWDAGYDNIALLQSLISRKKLLLFKTTSKLFSEETVVEEHRILISKFTHQLFLSIGKPFEKTTELERQILASFSFGAIHAQCFLNQLPALEIHKLAIFSLTAEFKYTPQQAKDFVEHLIQVASDKELHPTTHAIIHRGIDGHRQFINSDYVNLSNNINGILTLICP